MSVTAGESWTSHGLKFHGLSLSGIRTSMAMPELSLSFDVAQAYPFVLNLKNFFLTHGHMDHAVGVPYILSQKAMTRQPKPRFYMPPSLVEPLTRIMKTWEEIEEHTYEYDFIGLKPDERVVLNDKYFVTAWPALHRIEALGYTLFEVRKHLAPEFRGLPQGELARLAREGRQINEIEEIPMVSFTGDTRIEFLDQRPWIARSKILMMECTYLDDKKSIEHARQWGHLHLDELLPRLPAIEAEKIVLIHVSSRYPTAMAERILQDRLPAAERERVVIFPGR
ncbi:MAG: MBL fold metallo-hydrolase [Bdellovibrionaceae bacterium]|nr:MBL fold metallo-hydrolase [Pseudobdellovibrionaceae bacterium]